MYHHRQFVIIVCKTLSGSIGQRCRPICVS